MLEQAVHAFVLFFVTIGPIDVASVFAALAAQYVLDGLRTSELMAPLGG